VNRAKSSTAREKKSAITCATYERIVRLNAKKCRDSPHFTLCVHREVLVSNPQNLLRVAQRFRTPASDVV
jgi:hypothetical protein